MDSFEPVRGEDIPAALRPLAAEEAEAAKGWPELHFDAASWIEGGQVWVLELEPYNAETSPAGGGSLEEIHQSARTERADSESLERGVVVSESCDQSDESKTVPLACQQSNEDSVGDGETFSQSSKLTTNQKNHAKNPHACDQCDKAFQWASHLARHKQTHSRRAFRRSQRWSQKQSAVHMSQKLLGRTNHAKNLHTCDQCGRSFCSPSQLAQHYNNVHCESEAIRLGQNELEVFRPSLPHPKSLSITDQNRRAKRPHICKQCGKAFRYPSDLARHQHVHSRKNAARQNLCHLEACCPSPVVLSPLQAKNTFANSYKTLSEDSDSSTCTKNCHICAQCGKAFQRPAALAQYHHYEHFRGKAVRRNLGQSEACSLGATLAPFLLPLEVENTDSHKTLTKKSHICGHCGKNFLWPSDLARHKRTHTRRKQQKSYLCEHCGQRFKCASGFIQHLSVHSSERPYGCAICGFRCRRRAQLKKHQKWHEEGYEMEEEEEDRKHQGVHGQDIPGESIFTDPLWCLNFHDSEEDNKSFASLKSCECGECHATASDSLGHLSQNSIWEIGVSGIPRILPLRQTCECGCCGIDDGSFDMKKPLLPHLKTDIAACSELPSTMSTNSTVLNASSEVHKSIAYMERKITSTANTAMHTQWSHTVADHSCKRSHSPSGPIWLREQASPLADKEGPFVCPECPRQFSVLSCLVKHLDIHRPGKPYQCKTCKKRFAQRSYLHKHRKVHTVHLAHECLECGRCFTQISYLRKHMQRHTRAK